jgi:hypothetical protein
MYFALLRWVTEKVWLPRLGAEPAANQLPSLRFVQHEQESFWAPATRNRGPGTELSGHWQVTNLTQRNIVVVNARLTDTNKANGIAISIRVTAIPPGGTRQVHVGFSCFPPITNGEELVKLDLIFTDNYAKNYQVCAVFCYKRAPR